MLPIINYPSAAALPNVLPVYTLDLSLILALPIRKIRVVTFTVIAPRPRRCQIRLFVIRRHLDSISALSSLGKTLKGGAVTWNYCNRPSFAVLPNIRSVFILKLP